jgi:hypothetical protein
VSDLFDLTPTMNRSVMQLLFNYLPARSVDWENGAAIVVIDSPRLEEVWAPGKARLVLNEVSAYLARWRQRGGSVSRYPDPVQTPSNYVVATPLSVSAKVLMTALRCYECSQLVFHKRSYMVYRRNGANRVRCPNCKKQTLRQFGIVFVHGCGHLQPLTQEIPLVGRDGTPKKRYVRCEKCHSADHLMLVGKSDRVSGLTIVCRRCRIEVVDRLAASCQECARAFVNASGPDLDPSALRIHTLMRMTRHSASEAYYPHTLTVLRLGRVPIIGEPDAEMALLQRLLPPEARAQVNPSVDETIEELLGKVQQAKRAGDTSLVKQLLQRIADSASRSAKGEDAPPPDITPGLLTTSAPDVQKAVLESQALLETVRMRAGSGVAVSGGGAAAANVDEARNLLSRLGIRRLDVVDDLPIVSASFGFSRRSFEPTYEELGRQLSTSLRPFPGLDDNAALSADRRDIVGRHPILAREAEHEGIFLALDDERVRLWLAANGVELEGGPLFRAHLLNALEPVDRYYDDIWSLRVRRLVFGLVHSLSHTAMRAASYYSGLDRTSIGEYLFLPLLGTVIFANSATFKMGGMETLVRDHLVSFLTSLQDDATHCLYDPDCLDRRGACHGCIHSPEISCRAFNHGLSRSLLLGGRAPWPTQKRESLIGYWQLS